MPAVSGRPRRADRRACGRGAPRCCARAADLTAPGSPKLADELRDVGSTKRGDLIPALRMQARSCPGVGMVLAYSPPTVLRRGAPPPSHRTFAPLGAEGVGFEPTRSREAPNGFQDRRGDRRHSGLETQTMLAVGAL